MTADLEAFRAEARAFIAGHAPRFRQRAGVRSPETEQERDVLQRWTALLFERGYLGADWPVRHGGSAEHDPARDGVVAEELALAGAPRQASGSMLAARALIGFGTEEQRARYLPRIRSGADLWCQLFSEPEAGSDLASLRTRAVLDGDEYIVSGQKVWTTNGHWADLGYLLARTEQDAPKHRGISAFALDMHSPGVSVRPLREITGTSDFNEVFFDEVRVPAANMIGPPGQGWAIANATLAHERSGVGATVVELRRLWRELREQAERTGSGDGSAFDQRDVRQRLAGFRSEIETLALLVETGTQRWQAGDERPIDAPLAKLMFSELHLRMAEFGLSLPGPGGVFTEGDSVGAIADGRWADAFLYARAYTIAGGSSEIMRNVIAERGLGLPR
jgi:alkylation response protein AidB-like acyl-CoA dehydrogenase